MDALHNPRYHMWRRLLPGYGQYTPNEAFKLKVAYAANYSFSTLHEIEPNEQDIREANKHQTATKESVIHANMTWASYSTHFKKLRIALPGVYPTPKVCAIKENLLQQYPSLFDVNENDDIFSDVSEEKENIMRNEEITIIDPDAARRDYLRNRLFNIGNTRDCDARLLFKINGDPAPKSPKEFVERIKEGKFTFTSKYVKEDGTWRDGDKCYYGSSAELIEWRTAPADMEGYNAWGKADGERKTKIKDIINILTPEEALKAVQEYETSPII